MKVRHGFVSNSSSSSFVCEICGHSQEVYTDDLSSGPDITCENGHNMCRAHINPIPRDEAIKLVVRRAACSEDVKFGENATIDEIITAVENTTDVANRYDRDSLNALRRFVRTVSLNYSSIDTIEAEEFFTLALEDDELFTEQYDFCYSIPEELCPICQCKTISRENLVKIMIKDMGFTHVDDMIKHLTNRFETNNSLKSYIVDITL